VGIGSLNKQKIKMKVSEEKAEKASEIRDEINERESSDQNK
jgi:protein-arginine kinase activator protein McsA